MSIRVSRNKDSIALLEVTTNTNTTSNLNTYRSYYGGDSSNSSTKKSSKLGDTVHYISPATTACITEYEGDYYYQQFVDFKTDNLIAADDYPHSEVSTISCDEKQLQRTLAIIKPDALKYQDVVLRAMDKAGFRILNQRLLHLTPEQVAEIYQKHYGSPTFPHLVVTMSISPLLVISLAAKNCVEKWKTMIGPYGTLREEWFFPYSVRNRFGILNDITEVLHASESIIEAKFENRYFFPRSIIEPIPFEEEKVADYINEFVRPALEEGLIHIARIKPIDPILSLAEWLLLNNPYQPRFPEQIALSPL